MDHETMRTTGNTFVHADGAYRDVSVAELFETRRNAQVAKTHVLLLRTGNDGMRPTLRDELRRSPGIHINKDTEIAEIRCRNSRCCARGVYATEHKLSEVPNQL